MIRWLKKLYNKVRYRELYRELKEAQAELAEFQMALEAHRVKLKADIEAAQVIRDIQKQEREKKNDVSAPPG